MPMFVRSFVLLMCVALTVVWASNNGDEIQSVTENATNETNGTAANKTVVRTLGSSKDKLEMRKAEKWGTIEMIGSGNDYEYIKALFGGALHCKSEPLVMADPANACNTIQPDLARGRILFAWRGGCTFSDKAWFAQTAGAAGLIIGNTDQSIVRMPEGYHAVKEEEVAVPDITIPVVMVRQTSGQAIEKIVQRFGVVPNVAIVAKHWSSQGTFISGACKSVYRAAANASRSLPLTLNGNSADSDSSGSIIAAEGEGEGETKEGETKEGHGEAAPASVAAVATPRTRSYSVSDVEMLSTDGGRMHLVGDPAGRSFEYVRGNFGGPPPAQPLPIVLAEPIDGCTQPANEEAIAGGIVVVRRGKCSFTAKMQNMEAAGAMAVVLINSPGKILVQMSDGGLSEHLITVYPVMALHSAGDALVAAAASGGHGRFALGNFSVTPLWEGLRGVKDEEASRWPSTLDGREELYRRLRKPHDPEVSGTGSAERLAYIEAIYGQLAPLSGAVSSSPHSEL